MPAPAQTDPLVVIILVNWNGRPDTLACLASLRAVTYRRKRVLVVDNGSSDGSAAAIRAEYPEVLLIESPTNLGYVGGNNLGLRRAHELKAEYALLLNNDTVVAPDFLERMIRVAVEPTVGMVSPMIYYATLPETLWSAGGKVDWTRGHTQMVGEDQIDNGQFGAEPYETDFVSGCALLIRLAVVDQIGPLDERFFAYYEDAEWGVRARRAGYRVVNVPGAKVWHKILPEARFGSDSLAYYFTRNRLLFLRLTEAGTRAWFSAFVMDIGRTILSYAIRPKWRHKRKALGLMVRGLQDYWRGRFGRIPAEYLA